MKKAYISPVTSLLMSLSLVLGILVSDLRGYRLLTSAHAQEGSPCGVIENDVTVVGDTVNIENGLILSGITVRNVTVNGIVLDQAVIAGSVQISDATVVGSTGMVYSEEADAGPSGVIIGSESPKPNGVIIGSENPCSNGVIIGSESPKPNGVIIGSESPKPNGVIIGSENPSPSPNGVIIGSERTIIADVTGVATGTAVGGTLTGDDIIVTDGFVTGQNLLLSGATFNGGSVSGTITSVTITPTN